MEIELGKWMFNDYTFKINPSVFEESVEIVGDFPSSLNGTVYSLPTGMQTEYTISATFYQPRARLISEIGVNGHYIRYDSTAKRFHILNKNTRVISIYSNNFSTLHSTVTFPAPLGTEITGFDYYPGIGYYVHTKRNTANTYIYKVTTAGALSLVGSYAKTVTALKMLDGKKFWIVNSGSQIEEIGSTLVSSSKFTSLPFITYDKLGYQGIARYDKDFMIVLANGDETGIYHIDIATGMIVNYFALPSVYDFNDLAYDSDNDIYLVLSHTTNTIKMYRGNTVELDIYRLESTIKDNQSIYMTDDLGMTRRVNINNFGATRDETHPHKYTIDIKAVSIDRTV